VLLAQCDRTFCEKRSAQFCQNIAQNGALLSKNFWPNKIAGQIREFKDKPGTVVMVFKKFSPKNSAKKLAFFTQNKAKLFESLIIPLDFEKNVNFFEENCRKSQKIVIIITSTPERQKAKYFG
jgi:hypothetical protein